MTRAMSRPGQRHVVIPPKAGRPVSTGSSTTKPIVFRVTAEQRAELAAEAAQLGLPSADLAAKRRVFPS